MAIGGSRFCVSFSRLSAVGCRAAVGLRVDFLDDAEAARDLPKGGCALPVIKTFPTKVERRVVFETNEEVGGGRVGAAARHRDRALQ